MKVDEIRPKFRARNPPLRKSANYLSVYPANAQLKVTWKLNPPKIPTLLRVSNMCTAMQRNRSRLYDLLMKLEIIRCLGVGLAVGPYKCKRTTIQRHKSIKKKAREQLKNWSSLSICHKENSIRLLMGLRTELDPNLWGFKFSCHSIDLIDLIKLIQRTWGSHFSDGRSQVHSTCIFLVILKCLVFQPGNVSRPCFVNGPLIYLPTINSNSNLGKISFHFCHYQDHNEWSSAWNYNWCPPG